MNTIEAFAIDLNQLDPESYSFVLDIDQLLETTDPRIHQDLYRPIFDYFAQHATSSVGGPGPLVHHIETYYPNYRDTLKHDLAQRPSCTTALLANRILNTELSAQERSEWLGLLSAICSDPVVEPEIRADVEDYLVYQRQKD